MKTPIAEIEQVCPSPEFSLIAEYLNDKGGIWHCHPECEITLNIKNNGTRIIGNNVELFDEYDLVLIAGNVPHCYNYYKTEDRLPENHGITVHFSRTLFGEELLNQHEMTKVRQLLNEASRGVAFSVQDAKEAEKYLTAMLQHSGVEKIINFLQVINLMCNSQSRRILSTNTFKSAFDTYTSKRMALVYNYIKDNFNKQISLESISTLVNLKPFSFSKYFKKSTGSGFVEYINQVRTNRACYLLRETYKTISEIARECGFKSVSNFNKQFRKITGISPREYRSQYV